MPGGNLIIESGNILNTLNLNEDFENLFGQASIQQISVKLF